MGTLIKPGAVVAIYYDVNGLALQQEFITAFTKDTRMLPGDAGIPDRESQNPDETGGCPGTSFPCKKPGGIWGCCG